MQQRLRFRVGEVRRRVMLELATTGVQQHFPGDELFRILREIQLGVSRQHLGIIGTISSLVGFFNLKVIHIYEIILDQRYIGHFELKFLTTSVNIIDISNTTQPITTYGTVQLIPFVIVDGFGILRQIILQSLQARIQGNARLHPLALSR